MKVNLIILGLIIAFSLFLIGGFVSRGKPGTYTPLASASFCCDSGDGEACKPVPDKTISWGGQTYGLLRTKVSLIEGNIHLKDSGQKTPTGEPIIENSSDVDNNVDAQTTDGYNRFCRKNTDDDTYFKKLPTADDSILLQGGRVSIEQFYRVLQTYCTAVPNNEIVLVCRENCHPSSCPSVYQRVGASCYGDEKTVYDVYFRLSDYHEGQTPNGIPDFIKNCDKSTVSQNQGSEQEIVTPANEKPSLNNTNLHLKTFSVLEKAGGIVPWLSPFCKPAIYLYPKETSSVLVEAKPLGKMTFTDPQYPVDGWNVRANSNGTIEYNNSFYDYLYYEVEIPDTEITQPNEGFVIEYKNISTFLNDLLPKLGLNAKETEQFREYWTRVLPKSNYYKIGIVSRTHLDAIAPLSITPKPDTVIRVTLYFQALDTKEVVFEPTIKPIERRGFTVVEWGGIFKRDSTHNFSCFM